jgi:hypothetical protein
VIVRFLVSALGNSRFAFFLAAPGEIIRDFVPVAIWFRIVVGESIHLPQTLVWNVLSSTCCQTRCGRAAQIFISSTA